MFDQNKIPDILTQAVQKASKILKASFTESLTPEYKISNQDLVTKADYASQNSIHESIKTDMLAAGVKETEIGFIGEEGNLAESGTYLFAIDPIDGTTNFLSGIDYFVISIGCFVSNEVKFGIVHEPLKNTTYIAEKGKGAYKITSDGMKTKLTMQPHELSTSLLATYTHTEKEIREQELLFIRTIAEHARGIRITGAGALDLVKLADNVFQICMYGKSNIWDIAAAHLIIEEAGGKMVDFHGDSIQFDLQNPKKMYPLIACHPSLIEQVLTFL